jgi:hypothetical protein
MRVRRVIVAFVLAAGSATAYVLACGPFLSEYRSVTRVHPAHLAAYSAGNLGVVRPRFARKYLLQAYRRFTGQPALPGLVERLPSDIVRTTLPETPLERWQALRKRDVIADRRLPNYQSFVNCLDGAFTSALTTAQARIARYGADSPIVRDWFEAQDAVFRNCDGNDGSNPIVPVPVAADADPLSRADRAYQTAAAYFYAMRYDQAAQRFRAIAADGASPWQPYGRYLSARALIRGATVPQRAAAPAALADAEEQLRLTLRDSAASALHASARGLLDFIALRARPIERARELSTLLATAPTATTQQIVDYQRLMDTLLGDTTEFDYGSIGRRDELTDTSDVNDWIMAMQGLGAPARDRALAQWKTTGAVQWQIAAMWHLAGDDAEVPGMLRAAAAVKAASPAYPTVSFLAARLMFQRGNHDGARKLLAGLPSRPVAAFEPETINLLSALRMTLATTFDDFLRAAPRVVVAEVIVRGDSSPPPPGAGDVFDEDAAAVFSRQLPLARLVEAATATILPPRLRLRVAGAAFARGLLLGRYDAVVAVAPALRELAPALGADLARIESATTADDRHIAAIRLVLRTPGLRASVWGQEDDQSIATKGPNRTFDHTFSRNWWCSFEPNGRAGAILPEAEIVPLIYSGRTVPSPAFLTRAERAAADTERTSIATLGSAPTYLAREAVKWARARPTDLEAAEALAHAVEGTRWGCKDSQTTAASRAAFQTLHRLFPKSEWARRTKYWY